MRRFFIIVLSSVLLLSLLTGNALALSATYQNTKTVTEKFDSEGLFYTVLGIDSDNNKEYVAFKNESDAGEYTILISFKENNEEVNLRIFNIISYSDADFSKLLRTVNSMNYKYKWVRFYLDETDNTLTASMDLVVRPGDQVGDIVIDAMIHMTNVLDAAYESFSIYAK